MKKKGISLITLVITIVVIIILAAAVILSLGQNNPITSAKEARDKTTLANIEEEFNIYILNKYARANGSFNKDTFTVPETGENEDGIKMEDVLTSIKGTEYEGHVSITNGKLDFNLPNRATVNYIVRDRNKTLNGASSSYNNPIIPVGFKPVDTASAKWGNQDAWNNGLVIEDEDGNQFVWIPVDGTNIKYERLPDDIKTTGNYEILPSQAKDDTLPSGVTSESSRITKYGGFYVARYEASLPKEYALSLINGSNGPLYDLRTIKDASDNYYKPESKLNGFAWNYITYPLAKEVSENAYKTDYVKSGLLTGKQWDTMLKFIEQTGVNIATDSAAWGNYYNKTGYTVDSGYYKTGNFNTSNYTSASKTPYTKSANGTLLLTTGTFGDITNNHPKNLYDVAGNIWEWTNERVATKGGSNTAVDNPLLRGGSFDGGGGDSAAFRYGFNGTGTWYYSIGFRLVLYIQ